MRTVAVTVWCLVMLTAGARCDANLPDLGPAVISVFPLGARQGETLRSSTTWTKSRGCHRHRFRSSGYPSQVLSSDFYSVKARISVAATTPVGLHDYRLRTSRGTHVGVFHVGSLPRQNEREPNNDLQHAERISLPAMIDGIVDNGRLRCVPLSRRGRTDAHLRCDGDSRGLAPGQHDHPARRTRRRTGLHRRLLHPQRSLSLIRSENGAATTSCALRPLRSLLRRYSMADDTAAIAWLPAPCRTCCTYCLQARGAAR